MITCGNVIYYLTTICTSIVFFFLVCLLPIQLHLYEAIVRSKIVYSLGGQNSQRVIPFSK